MDKQSLIEKIIGIIELSEEKEFITNEYLTNIVFDKMLNSVFEIEYNIMLSFPKDKLLSVILSTIPSEDERMFVNNKLANKTIPELADILTSHIYMGLTNNYRPHVSICKFRIEIEGKETWQI